MYRRHRECLNKSYFALCSVEYTLHNRDYNCACCVSYTLVPFEINPLDIKKTFSLIVILWSRYHLLIFLYAGSIDAVLPPAQDGVCQSWHLTYCTTVAPKMPVLFIVKKIYFYYTFRKLYIQRIYVDIQSTCTQICLITFMYVYSTYSKIIHK